MRVWWFFAREVAGSLVIGNSVLPSSDGQGPHSRRTAHLDQERGNCAGGRSCPAQRPKPSLHCWSLVQPRVPMMHQRRVIPCRSSCFSSGVVREAEKHPHRRQVRLFQGRTDALTVNTRQRSPCSSHPKFVNTRVRLCGKEKEDFVTLQYTVQTLGGRIRHSRSPCWNVDLEHIGAQGGMRKSILAAKLAGVVHGTIAPAPLSSACILSATSAKRDDGTQSLPRVAFRTVGGVWSHWFLLLVMERKCDVLTTPLC